MRLVCKRGREGHEERGRPRGDTIDEELMTLKRGLFCVNCSATRYWSSVHAAARWLLARAAWILQGFIIRGGVSIMLTVAIVLAVGGVVRRVQTAAVILAVRGIFDRAGRGSDNVDCIGIRRVRDEAGSRRRAQRHADEIDCRTVTQSQVPCLVGGVLVLRELRQNFSVRVMARDTSGGVMPWLVAPSTERGIA